MDVHAAVKLAGRTSVDPLESGGDKRSALESEETRREPPVVAERPRSLMGKVIKAELERRLRGQA